jgi:hypothetical protein
MPTKTKPSKLDPFGERLEEWFLLGQPLVYAQEQLALDGCKVTLSRLSVWWQHRQAERAEAALLAQIATGAKQCREIETAMQSDRAPELKMLIGLHRVLILKMSTEGNLDPDKLELVNRMMREVQKFARLEQLEKQNVIEERKLALLEEKAKQADAARGITGDAALTSDEKASRMREVFGIS